MSDFGTPTKTQPDDQSPSQEPARKRRKVRHYPLNMDIVDEPKGDLVIKVGQHEDDVGLVRVHKAILMMASPTFREILLKLDANRKYDENDPLILDEDRTAFIDFCMVVHHQTKDQQAVPISRYAGLAVIFHKYSCMSMLERNIAWPLREFFGSSLEQFEASKLKSSGMRLEDTLCISYLSGDAKLFYRCSRFMITRITADRHNGNFKANKSLFKVMPEGMLEHMQAVRTHHLNDLEDKIYKPISDLTQAVGESIEFCQVTQLKLTRYTLGLCAMKCGASRLAGGLSSLSATWLELDALAKQIGEIEQTACPDCGDVCAVPMAEPILRALEGIGDEVGGLCLYCERQGKSPMGGCEHTVPM